MLCSLGARRNGWARLSLDSSLLEWILAVLVRYGPAVIFIACLLETAIFAGLLVPVGATIGFSAMLASRGVLETPEVIAAALTGALAGDQIGYFFGRLFQRMSRPRDGRLARLWIETLTHAQRLLDGRGVIGVALARGIPFVRTIMPWVVGRSGIGWPRFTAADVLGVGFWGLIYIGGGFAAGMGWREVAQEYGEAAGAVIALLLLGAFVLLSGGRGPFRRRPEPPAMESE